MYERKQINIILERLQGKKNLIQFISGPRQIGKTTLAEQLIKKIKYPYHFVSADAVPSSNRIWINQQWDYARFGLKQLGSKLFLLILTKFKRSKIRVN